MMCREKKKEEKREVKRGRRGKVLLWYVCWRGEKRRKRERKLN